MQPTFYAQPTLVSTMPSSTYITTSSAMQPARAVQEQPFAPLQSSMMEVEHLPEGFALPPSSLQVTIPRKPAASASGQPSSSASHVGNVMEVVPIIEKEERLTILQASELMGLTREAEE